MTDELREALDELENATLAADGLSATRARVEELFARLTTENERLRAEREKGGPVRYGCGCVARVSWDRSTCEYTGHEPQSDETAAIDMDICEWHNLRSVLGMDDQSRYSIADVEERVRQGQAALRATAAEEGTP